jgi:hypothetical protein
MTDDDHSAQWAGGALVLAVLLASLGASLVVSWMRGRSG